MTKKKIDTQKTGQSSATPFVQVNDCSQSIDRSYRSGVTFDMKETLERHSDSIDKLTSIVSKMNVKMDKKETPYKPRVLQGRPRGQNRGRQQNFQPAIGPSAKEEIETEEILIIGTIIDTIIETGPEIIIDVTTERMATSLMKDKITIDKTAEGEIAIDRAIEIDKVTEELTLDKDSEIGVKVEICQEKL